MKLLDQAREVWGALSIIRFALNSHMVTG